jgi:uncharacterized protein (TIGR03435 family)
MVRAIAGLAVFVSGAVYGQSTVNQQFEVASVKPSQVDSSSSSSGIKTGHGRIDASNVTLKRCIMGAYGVGPHQISAGPAWLDSDRFEIVAKADQPVDDDAVLMLMLQGLLAERFKLLLHRETRTIPAFLLEVAKNGPRLEKAENGEATTNTSTGAGGVIIDARHADMDSFAKILARKMDMPVVNYTGLGGQLQFQTGMDSRGFNFHRNSGAARIALAFTEDASGDPRDRPRRKAVGELKTLPNRDREGACQQVSW